MRPLLLLAGIMMLVLVFTVGDYLNIVSVNAGGVVLFSNVVTSLLTLIAGVLVLKGLWGRRRGRKVGWIRRRLAERDYRRQIRGELE